MKLQPQSVVYISLIHIYTISLFLSYLENALNLVYRLNILVYSIFQHME